jgi:hypothetical protein
VFVRDRDEGLVEPTRPCRSMIHCSSQRAFEGFVLQGDLQG